MTSAFTQFLADLVENVPGAVGAVIQDVEGETVEAVGHLPDFDLMVHAAHWGLLWRDLRFSARSRQLKETRQIWIETSRQKVLLTTLFQDYYLVFILSRETAVIEALRLLDRHLNAIREEMGL